MAILTRTQLKALWISLFKPFQTNYDDVWDSFIAPEDSPALDGMTNKFEFGGQAHSGNSTESFSVTKQFNANAGTVQEMDIEASTAISIINDLPGTYTFRLKIITGTPPVITPDSSFGVKLPNSPDFVYTNGTVNILTMVKWKSGAKDYVISN